MWVPPEVKEPVLLHHPTRKSVGYFGAIRLRDGKFCFSREAGPFDAVRTWAFLRHLHAVSRRTGRRVAVIIDNAKYHHAALHKRWRMEREPGFELLFLPPYSPELNPIERVWKLVRRLRLHNRYFPELSDVVESVETLFLEWSRRSEVLRRLCRI
jgi:transposase